MHTGLVDVKAPDEGARFGIKTKVGIERIEDCLQPKSNSAAEQFITQQKERSYRSRMREPLGSGYVRGHDLPQGTRDLANFDGFGIPSTSDITAGSLIHYSTPDSRGLVRPEMTRLIVFFLCVDFDPTLTHFNKERTVTKPLQRNYDWTSANIDPSQHRFGHNPDLLKNLFLLL